MLFGHNSNVTVNGVVLHVQTEDRGTHSAIIDTTVYYRGQVLHRRKQSYSDLLPLDADREQALKLRLDDQHATMMQDLRSGTLPVTVQPLAPVAQPKPPVAVAAAATSVSPALRLLVVDLLNPRTWLTGKHATLYVTVRSTDSGAAAGGARVSSHVLGADNRSEVSAMTSADGHAQLQFDMPRLIAEDAALVIEAVLGEAHGQLRFQLRAKPKVPAPG